MKKVSYFYGVSLIILSAGCFTPINTTFDSAKLLTKGEVEIQGNGSLYRFGSLIDNPSIGTNKNLGLSIGYGISDRINVKLRYEYLRSGFSMNLFDEEITLGDIHYLELGGKIPLVKNKLALTVPLGVYFNQNGSFYCIDPRLTYTYRLNKIFEASVIPKTHLLFAEDEFLAMPGINIGLGISSNLDKWAIRPEFGYDFNLVFGVGLTYYFKPRLLK